jgi:hypothetical protein
LELGVALGVRYFPNPQQPYAMFHPPYRSIETPTLAMQTIALLEGRPSRHI